MKNFKIFDMHADTLTACFDNKKSLLQNDLHIDIKSIMEFKSFSQFLAVFVSPKYYGNPKKRCLDVINYFKSQLDFCKTFDDVRNGTYNALLSIEGGEAINDFETLDLFYELGVRMITLTWNNDNHIGGANGSSKGLTEFGKELILRMNKKGIIADLSHASEKTFYDVIKITNKPIVLSHSNSHSLCPHPRNITDLQFEEVKRLNGVVGINFYPPFLSTKNSADIYDIVNHIEHFLSLGGENNIGLGSDFDGIDVIAEGINSVRDIDKIFNILSNHGISNEIIEKIAYKNITRVIGICL